MRTTCMIALSAIASCAIAQTPVDKIVPVVRGQKIRMHFDYPEMVRVSTWEKNEISIQGTVSINGGENDDAFALLVDTGGDAVTIRNEIRNMKSLPHRVTVECGGQKIVFRSRAEWRKYQDEHGSCPRVSEGVDLDIVLEIRVPRGVETVVQAVYGIVEVREFSGPITVEATYGGVDASLVERNVGELIAETNYGNIYTNLEFKVNNKNVREEDFHTFVSATPGTGPRYRFESKYGNVYLRKGN